MSESRTDRPHRLRVQATSNADDLGYLGQKAVADAVPDGDDYRIIGGHMVRLLQVVYPTQLAVPRTTMDADAAIADIEVVGAISDRLLAQDFEKPSGNLFTKFVDGEGDPLGGVDGRKIEINLLVPRADHTSGIRPVTVPGVGEVDSLPELSFAMAAAPLILHVTSVLRDGREIEYRTRIPGLEAATVLKARAWGARRSDRDLADLSSLLEIREEHPEVPWKFAEVSLIGHRRDAARVLHDLAAKIARRNFAVPTGFDRKRFAALVLRHVTRPR